MSEVAWDNRSNKRLLAGAAAAAARNSLLGVFIERKAAPGGTV